MQPGSHRCRHSAPPTFVLEDGVRIGSAAEAQFRTGDYWLFPARTASGDVEWPSSEVAGQRQAQLQEPDGVTHQLGLPGTLAFRDRAWQVGDCRCSVAAAGLASCP
ncbi:DUF6519 domain-containing protein [Massilia sp. PWRC2]|uniref:DUF6519 domain-containing protein n=1 Tax=Massilia sp. PWRC2 TaxID=2804626 RepID=UPI003CF89CB2